jgi:hypothetical protein
MTYQVGDSHIRLYQNGVEVNYRYGTAGAATDTIPPNTQIRTNTAPLNIGMLPVSLIQYFNGIMDELRIMSRALTPGEIMVDYGTSYRSSGNLTSVLITPPAGKGWDRFNVSADRPSGTGSGYSILNGSGGTLIPSVGPGADISSLGNTPIRLYAVLTTGNPSSTPLLNDWTVTEKDLSYTITASAGSNGSISPLGAVSVNYGANQTFSITPGANYHVADVLVDNVSQGAITTYTFNNVTINHTISATFAINTTVTLQPSNIVLTFSQVTDPSCIFNASATSTSPPQPTPSGYNLISVYNITSCVVGYTGPISVTIPYNESSVPQGMEGNLKMFHWNGNSWEYVPCSVNTANNTVTGQVNSLSPFGIGYSYSGGGGGGGGGYSTGANTNMIAVLALFAIAVGLFILRKNRWIKV